MKSYKVGSRFTWYTDKGSRYTITKIREDGEVTLSWGRNLSKNVTYTESSFKEMFIKPYLIPDRASLIKDYINAIPTIS